MKKQYWGLVVALAVFASLQIPLAGGFTDDGYIHIQYASNIIARGEYSFNPGEVSFGTTSPLWVLMHAAVGGVAGGGERLMTVSRVFSWLGGVAALLLMFVFARRMGLGQWTTFLCTLTFAAHVWLVRWTALAMESSTAVAAITAAGLTSVGALRDPGRAWRLGFFMAVAALLRPEAYLLVPVYGLTVALQRRRVRIGCVIRTAAMYALLIAPWLTFAHLHIGTFLPNTAGAKSGGVILNPLQLLDNLIPIARIIASAEAVPVLVLIAAVLLLRKKSRIFSADAGLLLLWVLALPLAYALFDIQVLSRYMLLTSPFVVVLGFVALEECAVVLRWPPATRRRATGAIALVAVSLNVILYFMVVVGPSRAFSRGLTQDLKQLALFVHRNTAEDAVVAAADIGYLAFYSGRRVLDLGGLVENATGELRERYTYEDIVDGGLYLDLPGYPHVDYFIDRVHIANRFDGKTVNGHRFESVRVDRIDNLGIKKPGPFYYTLYRLQPVNDG